jgi:hypothetical protein
VNAYLDSQPTDRNVVSIKHAQNAHKPAAAGSSGRAY